MDFDRFLHTQEWTNMCIDMFQDLGFTLPNIQFQLVKEYDKVSIPALF
jgi:hypothetical protein